MSKGKITDKVKLMSMEFNLPYEMALVNSADIDTTTYQRTLNRNKVRRIAAEFDERVANEPKLSYRDGKYYVFDGQHTIAARKEMNEGKDIPIVCKVFYDLTKEDEALLFAEQTGVSSKPTPGITLRAKEIGKDIRTLTFVNVNESLGIQPSYSNARGKFRIRCINTARAQFNRIGAAQYKEAMTIIVDAWEGKSASFVSEVIVTICEFVNIYNGEYDRKRLVRKLSYADPYDIVKAARTIGEDGGKKKALSLVLDIYNTGKSSNLLPIKY